MSPDMSILPQEVWNKEVEMILERVKDEERCFEEGQILKDREDGERDETKESSVN